jgi:hypothetical protein
MGRRIVFFSTVLTAVFFSFCLAHAQIAEKEKEWEKTITLPSGEVIYDLNGEWAAYVEHYGPLEGYGRYPDIVEIKQQGASFVGIRQIGNPWMPKGSEFIRGELDKNGFKKIQIISGMGPLDAKGQILPWYDIGKQITVDDGEKYRAMLIRR